MTQTRYGNRVALPIALLVLTIPLSTACGTLEIGIESMPTPGDLAAATATALAAENGEPATEVATSVTESTEVPRTPGPTPMPIPPATELRVAFVNVTEHGNNAWLWTEGAGDAVALTKDGGVGDVKISDDGEIVAFTRGDGLWMVRSDGADGGRPAEERPLVSAEDFAAMEGRDPELVVVLNRFEWVPGTHVLAFNTRLRTEIGLVLNDDLHLVDANTLERTALLPPGEGGEFIYAPDGRQIAIVTPGSIHLVDANGGNRRDVFTYTPVATQSEAPFYAQPVWAADSSALRVAIPPVDASTFPFPPATVWHIRTDGTPASLIASVVAGQRKLPALSPDLRYVAHLDDGQSAPPADPISSLLITDLDSGETTTYYPQPDAGTQSAPGTAGILARPAATLFYGWAPDSQHFAFLAQSDSDPQAQIGQLGGDFFPVYSDADTIIDLRWVDADRYLFLASSPKGWDVMLGKIGGPVRAVAGVVGSPPAYDFAAPTRSPAAGDEEDRPLLSGLVYQSADGLWYVNANGEPVWIFDRPGAVISPDLDQVLYIDGDDTWLANVSTGERRNLTQTPDRFECCAQWWPGRSDAAPSEWPSRRDGVLFNSRTPEQEGPNYGFLTTVRLDGTGYQVLDDGQVAFALFAPSPDGQTVAYDRAAQPWLYRTDTGPEPFDLTPYGLSSDPAQPPDGLRVVSPAWSPEGKRLAWVVGDCRQGECVYSIGVFDLEADTAWFLHPYTPVGVGGQPPAAAWSPDGRWLAFNAWSANADEAGLWVARADGGTEEEYPLDPGVSRANPHPVWSPDGRWLAFISTPQGVGSGAWLAEEGTWELRPLDLPPDALVVDWVGTP